MKTILIICALFFSVNVYSAPFIQHGISSFDGVAAPAGIYIGYEYGCGEASCSLNLFDPSIFLPTEIYQMYYGDLDDIDDEYLFVDKENIHLREMWVSQTFQVIKNAPINFEWNATGVDSFYLSFDGNNFDATSGSFLQKFYIGQEFNIYMAGEAFSADANLQLKMTDLSQVPIPAALYLFAPALLGFIGLRKKIKSS